MNQRYNNMIYFSTARSTHRNNGKVQLGITVVLRAQNITPNMAQHGTATVIQQGVMPVQVQGVPVQLPNGQIVYQVAAQSQVQGVPIQQQMNQIQPVPMQQVVVPIQQQQQQQAGPPQYQPPNMNVSAPPPAYNYGAANEGGEGVRNANNINGNVGATTGGPDQYQ